MKKPQAIVNDKDVKRLVGIDTMFAHIQSLYGLPPNWNRPPGFESLCKIILEQQVSLASAQAHFNKLNEYVGTITPQALLHLTGEEMRLCQISRQKAKYLQALAEAILSGHLNLDELHRMPEDNIRQQLMNIKGIGIWTTDIYLMFCLQAKDIFPLGDIAVLHTVKELTHAITPDQIAELTQQWTPFRSLAAFFCWHYYLCKRGRSA
jgi:DNA-3-methyladenine glycosylase II